MEQDVPLVTVLVSNYNESDRLPLAIRSVLESNYRNIEVVVVDDGSTDSSVELAKASYGKDPRCRFVVNERPLGVAETFNIGCREAKGDFILIVHSDARVHPDALGNLLRALQQDSSIAAAQAKVLSSDNPGLIQSAGRVLPLDRFGLPMPREASENVDRGQFETEEEILAAWTACALYRTAALKKVGYFEADYFLFYEDIDLGWRLWLAGYRVVYTPTAVAWHKSRLGAPKVTPTTTYYYSRHILLIVLKNYGLLNLLLISPVTFSLLLARGVAWLLPGRWRRGWAVFRAMGWILGHPRHIWRLRGRVQRMRHVPDKVVTRLMAGPAFAWHFRRLVGR